MMRLWLRAMGIIFTDENVFRQQIVVLVNVLLRWMWRAMKFFQDLWEPALIPKKKEASADRDIHWCHWDYLNAYHCSLHMKNNSRKTFLKRTYPFHYSKRATTLSSRNSYNNSFKISWYRYSPWQNCIGNYIMLLVKIVRVLQERTFLIEFFYFRRREIHLQLCVCVFVFVLSLLAIFSG